MMHEGQVPIDLGTARALIHDQFPQWSREPVVSVPSDGTVNAIFQIGSELAARFPLQADEPDAVAASLDAEAAAMSEMSEVCPFPSPLPIAFGRPGSTYPMPWSIQTWIPGTVATPTGLSGSVQFGHELAELIATLRAADTRGRQFRGGGRGGHLPDHDEVMAHYFLKSEGLFDVAPLRSLWARLRELPSVGPDVMSHRDLIPANLLVRGERLVGVLDAGGFGPADRALDLVAAWHHLERDGREALRERLGSGAVEWQRGAAWALQQAMGLA